MRNKNQVWMTAMITKNESVKSGDATWGVLSAVPFYEDSLRNSPIRIVLHEIVAERKGRGLVAGDIVLFNGKLSYYADLGYTLYADNFVILSKTKKEIPQDKREIACMAYSDIPSNICVVGRINNIAGDVAIVKVKRSSPVRGEIKDYDILPIKVQTPSNYKKLDRVFFNGRLEKGELIGELINLTPKEKTQAKENA